MADERQDLLKDIDEAFYGGGQAPSKRPVPTPTPVPTSTPRVSAVQRLYQPVQYAGVPLYASRVMSADNPNTQFGIFDVARPPRQIPLNQFAPTEGEIYMQNWYRNLVSRFLSRGSGYISPGEYIANRVNQFGF